MTPSSTNNGASAGPPVAAAHQDETAALPAPAASLPALIPSGDRAADVMAGYQAVMQHFLETQRAVMLAFLGAPRAEPAPALAPPVAAPVVLPPTALQETAPVAAAEIVAPAAPPPSAPPPPPPDLDGDGRVAIGSEEIRERLLGIVSERTGYPIDMLALDADLEGDLGIDSIKRVEIAGTLTQTIALPDGVALDPEELTASRTLAQVIAVLEAALGTGAPEEAPPDKQPAEDGRPFELGPAEEERIGRFVLQTTSAPAITATTGLAADGAVVIVDDETGVGEALADSLALRGEPALLAPARDHTEPDAAKRLALRLRAEHGRAKALVHLAALGERGTEDATLHSLFALAQALRPDLEAAAAAGGAAVLGATRLGGTFGVATIPPHAALQGAVPGFLKSLAHEWPEVRMKAVDLSAAPPEAAARHLLDELGAVDGVVEIGYRDGERIALGLAPAPFEDQPAEAPLDEDSVVLVTGGARGVTAAAATSLAERYRPTLVLVGRTPAEVEEDQAIAALADPGQLRDALIARRRREGAELTPVLVERDLRSLLRAREVRENLDRMRATGARVEYMTCDVGDARAFAALIEQTYARHGRIDGVIHGAGVIEDRLVRHKQRDSLERVMATKAQSAGTLAERLRPEGLRFLVFFSSVSGRFGNRGQADYAAASEVLNKLAQELDRRWAARVVAINWGPWATTGMVSPEVARQFAERGVGLIPLEAGCRLLDDELRHGRKGEVEVVISASTAPALPLLAGAMRLTLGGGAGLELVRRLDLVRDRFLADHRVDGRPVLPFAVAMGLMAEAAAAARPGSQVIGLREIRLLHGVTLDDDEPTDVRISAQPAPAPDELKLRITAADGARPHYRALVELRGPDSAPEVEWPAGGGLTDLPPFPMTIEAAYHELLFHGPLFQGIDAIEGMDERGAISVLRPSDPGRCVAGTEMSRWLLDPVLLDSALQVQVVWARLNWDVTLLPAEIAGHRLVLPPAERPPEREPVRHELLVRPDSERPFSRCDHRFYLADGRLLATLEGVVGVGAATLNRLAEESA